MKKILLTAVVAASTLGLGGCMVIDSEEHCRAREVRVIQAPPVRHVEVYRVPGPPPRPYGHHPRSYGWR